MLSPGRWHEAVPRERTANLRYRRFILEAAKDNPEIQRGCMEMARLDFLWWLNTWVFQFNPRKKGFEVGPFISWAFQDTASLSILRDHIEIDEDLLVEKSREMGATWLLLLIFLWCWLFYPNKKFLCMSRSEKAVEDADPDSLFWKLDFVLKYLPGWMRPEIKRSKLFLGNLTNGSSITGEASTGKAGVGGRATAMLIDEFSQITEDFEVLHRTSDTTGCRIFNGTHKGQDTAFFHLSQRPDMKKLRMHWTQHPDKNPGVYRALDGKAKIIDRTYKFPADMFFVLDGTPVGGLAPGIRSPWYDKECKRKGSERAVAMDLDVDPAGSSGLYFDPVLIQTLRASIACPPVWEGDVIQDSEGKWQLKAMRSGPLKLWCQVTSDGKPIPGRYGAGADLSTGEGATPSCIAIYNADTGEKAAEFASASIRPADLAPKMAALLWMFKDQGNEPPLFAWEQQGPGLTFGNAILPVYSRVYYNSDDLDPSATPSDRPGWYPTDPRRRLLLDAYQQGLRTRACLNRSDIALEECKGFRYDKRGNPECGRLMAIDDPSGARVNHGDRVIADGLAWKMCLNLGGSRQSKEKNEPPVLSLAWRKKWHEDRQRQESAEW